MSPFRTYYRILQSAGTGLIVGGSLDWIYQFYCFVQSQNYSIHSGLFALIAGGFLRQASLKAVPIITGWVAFTIAYVLGTLFILFPLFKPIDFWLIAWSLNPFFSSISLIIKLLVIALWIWVYIQLRSRPVVLMIERSGYLSFHPNLAFGLGFAYIAFLASLMYFSFNGTAGARAMEIARTQYGETYRYFLTSVRWSNEQIQATLTAYNEEEIKPIQVEWTP